LDFKNGLPYLWCRNPTETENSSLKHIIMAYFTSGLCT
jgi:hypothetical protein